MLSRTPECSAPSAAARRSARQASSQTYAPRLASRRAPSSATVPPSSAAKRRSSDCGRIRPQPMHLRSGAATAVPRWARRRRPAARARRPASRPRLRRLDRRVSPRAPAPPRAPRGRRPPRRGRSPSRAAAEVGDRVGRDLGERLVGVEAAVARARQRRVGAAPAVGHDRRAAPVQLLLAAAVVAVLLLGRELRLERMSIRQPVSRAASRAFWPSRPMARLSWSSGTMTVARRASSSTSTSRTRAGLSALATNRAGSSL